MSRTHRKIEQPPRWVMYETIFKHLEKSSLFHFNFSPWCFNRWKSTGEIRKLRTFILLKKRFLKIDWISIDRKITFWCFSAQTNANRDQLLHGQPQHLRLANGVAQLSTQLHLHAQLRLGFRSGTVHGIQLHSLLDGRVFGVYAGIDHAQ